MGLAYLFGGKFYDFLDEHFEKIRYAKIRKGLLKNINGKILDAGCGTGRNFEYYNKKADVIGVDNSEKMLEVARKRIIGSKAKISVIEMDLRKLSLGDNTFDNIVASFALCVMNEKDELLALNELIRVAKRGARLYFLEYVYSQNPIRKILMFIMAFIPRVLYGLRFNSTLPVVERENRLKIEKTELVYDDVVRLIVAKKL